MKTPKDPNEKHMFGIGIKQKYIGLAAQEGLDVNEWIDGILRVNIQLQHNIANFQKLLQNEEVEKERLHQNIANLQRLLQEKEGEVAQEKEGVSDGV